MSIFNITCVCTVTFYSVCERVHAHLLVSVCIFLFVSLVVHSMKVLGTAFIGCSVSAKKPTP